MAGNEDDFLIELLGRDDPVVQALVAASKVPGMGEQTHEMLRAMVRERGWDPDDPPAFALPRDLSPSDYPVGTAMSGDVAGEEVGPSEEDLPGHIGVFGQTSTGKTTIVKLLLLQFTGRTGQERARGQGRTFFVWDARGEYIDLPRYFPRGEVLWLEADELGLNPFEVPVGRDGRRVMSPERWINSIREWLRILWLNEPSLNLLCEVLLADYQQRGLLGENHV